MVESAAATASGQNGYVETCTWGSDGQGACVVEVSFFGESTGLGAVTQTGTKNPFTTVVVSVPTTSSNHASSLRFSGGTQLVIAMSVITILEVVGGFMIWS